MKALHPIRKACIDKLDPDLVKIPDFIRAVLGYLLGVGWTEPEVNMLVLRGEWICGKKVGEPKVYRMITKEDLVAKILVIAHDANLEPRERTYILNQIDP